MLTSHSPTVLYAVKTADSELNLHGGAGHKLLGTTCNACYGYACYWPVVAKYYVFTQISRSGYLFGSIMTATNFFRKKKMLLPPLSSPGSLRSLHKPSSKVGLANSAHSFLGNKNIQLYL